MKRVFLLLVVVIAAIHLSGQRPAYAQQLDSEEEGPERVSPLQKLQDNWDEWPPSKDFKITLEYRNYTYLEGESRGDSRDSINEGRLEIEYDRDIGDNMRLFIDALLQDDDDNFTHGFVDDFEDDDLKRNYFNFTEAFLDIYFTDFDLRLGKQIITWGKADVSNPTDNINPTDYSNLVDDETIGVVAANLNYYWNDWNLQVIGVPGFTPTRLPPQGTRFSFIPPDGMAQIGPFSVPIMDPELPSNSIDNAQYGLRLLTTYEGWDFSASFYDGINSFPAVEPRLGTPPNQIRDATLVPVYHRYRAIGADFATTFDEWGFHGEVAHLAFDSDIEDARLQYVIGLDYTRSNVLFDHDIFAIVEYVGEEVTDERKEGFDSGTSLDRVLVGALAWNITYEFTEYTKLELRGVVDFHQGDDYYFQPMLTHQVSDEFAVTVGFDILGGPADTFFGEFKDNDRIFTKLKYAF